MWINNNNNSYEEEEEKKKESVNEQKSRGSINTKSLKKPMRSLLLSIQRRRT